jgi:predicted secreted protein
MTMYQTLSAEVGKPLKIAFEEATAGGYVWHFSNYGDLEVSSQPIVNKDEKGVPVLREFTLIAKRPGRHEVVFFQKRPWEDNSIKRRPFIVNAR